MINFDFSALVKDKQKIAPALQNRANELIYKHSIEMYKRMLKRTPVDTGNMIESWEYDTRLSSRGWAIVNIENTAEYAIYVNDGTVDSDGNFLVELSLNETLQNLKRDLLKPRRAGQLLDTKEPRPPRAIAIGQVPQSIAKRFK